MKLCSKFFTRIASCVLVVLMLFSLLAASAVATFAADAEVNAIPEKVKRTYDIAVVYDNSGSMYNGDMWCQAKYALEIFASMLNYTGGDKLTIYPMWPVTTDPVATENGSYSPIVIDSKEDIDLIHNMYTTDYGKTPFVAVTEAYNGLKNSTADEKWLLILTDGEFTENNRNEKKSDEGAFKKALFGEALKEKLLELASEDIKVQFLYLEPKNEKNPKRFEFKPAIDLGLYFYRAKSADLREKLIQACNDIFQRAELKNALKGDKLTLDISMSSLIVFAQGDGAKIQSLVDSDGNEVAIKLDSGQRTYSERSAALGSKRLPLLEYDRSLAGQVVTFSACKKGEYTLNLTGVNNKDVQIFYEPDVDIEVVMLDSQEKEVDRNNPELPAGKYTITSRLVDRVTREEITKSDLMGKVELKTVVKNGSDEYVEYENGDTITFVPDEDTQVYIEGHYLEDYTISTKDNTNMFPADWIITAPETDLKVKAEVLQSGEWYVLKKHDSWKPVKIDITLKGKKLTKEQFDSTVVTVEFSESMPYKLEPAPDESAYYVYLGVDNEGKYKEVALGEYDLVVNAAYTDPLDEVAEDSDKVKFTVERYGKIIEILKWILIIAAIIAIICWLIYHKTFPKEITLHKALKVGFDKTGVPQDIGGSMSFDDGSDYIFACSAKKITPAIKRKKPSAKIKLTDIELGPDVSNLKIGGTRITPNEKTAIVMNDDIIRYDKGANKIPKKYKIKINEEL